MDITEMNLQNTGDKDLFTFLLNAPKEFREGEKIRKYQLQNGDYVHCVLWNMHFYITGTDIVKILVWRFQNAGRTLQSIKKFEEGVFSDLRNLKPGIDATLEGPRSDFLEFLYKNGCIRTQKKQKVFYWYSVPHDALFCDALERDLRRETNLYTYSKYMNNIATQNFLDGMQPFQVTQPYMPRPNHQPPQSLKKKNSVKMATRHKRSPLTASQIREIIAGTSLIKPSSKPNAYGMIEPLNEPPMHLNFDAFNPTHPDPFLDFGPMPENYNQHHNPSTQEEFLAQQPQEYYNYQQQMLPIMPQNQQIQNQPMNINQNQNQQHYQQQSPINMQHQHQIQQEISPHHIHHEMSPQSNMQIHNQIQIQKQLDIQNQIHMQKQLQIQINNQNQHKSRNINPQNLNNNGEQIPVSHAIMQQKSKQKTQIQSLNKVKSKIQSEIQHQSSNIKPNSSQNQSQQQSPLSQQNTNQQQITQMKEERIYGMPEFFSVQKNNEANSGRQNSGMDDTNDSGSTMGNGSYMPNIPNSHGNPQK
ncbi:hypothetical protein EDEG_00254 [Edhazardia aedis USNM 41457]|uniref:Uncharacterized protein n=1 Tax=Edhazardia aedis (strain USNM 41457) TaxID=1003232 RepID=J9DN47_EDHAE|nr:hypothetical protein EDEG_00254 [Edhazardia aedis USNM 41457]|eukprot:EJW02797.1 hypothetical protein EDEG_00254 [Edhazardia aedis USNM 41457]